MSKQNLAKCAALFFLVHVLSPACDVFAGTGQRDVEALAALKPPDILAQLVQAFSGSGSQLNEGAQYLVVQRYLDQYVVAIGSKLSVKSIEDILDHTKRDEDLQANVFFWFYQSGNLNALDPQDRVAAYLHIENAVRQSKGQAFRIGVGLLRRRLSPEHLNAMGNSDAAKGAAVAILKMTREHMSQGVHSDKDEAVTRSVLEDVRKLRSLEMLDEKSYSELLRSCVTNVSLRGGIRARSAALLLQENTNSTEVIRLLQDEAENARNDEALRKDFGALLDKGKP